MLQSGGKENGIIVETISQRRVSPTLDEEDPRITLHVHRTLCSHTLAELLPPSACRLITTPAVNPQRGIIPPLAIVDKT